MQPCMMQACMLADWSTALDFVTERSGSERLVVVLDEFPYLAGSAPGLE